MRVWRDEWEGVSGCVNECIVHAYICRKSCAIPGTVGLMGNQ